MTLYQSDVFEFLEVIRSGGDLDTVRAGAELIYQALIEAEATEKIGARPLRAHRGAGDSAQRAPLPGALHQGR